MIGPGQHRDRPSRDPRRTARGLAITLAAATLGGALLACAGGPQAASSSEPTDSAATARAHEPTERGLSSSEAARAVDLVAFVSDSLVARQGTCLPLGRAPGRSRLIYSLLPGEASYLRLTVVTSPDGTQPVMVDLARGLTGRRILYATLTHSTAPIRLETFRSASDRHPIETDLSTEAPAARGLRTLAERALTLRCEGA